MSLKEVAAKSVFWSMTDRFASQGIQFIVTLVIARILTPEDFGLIAMLSIFIAIAQTVVDSGFANALIQKKERTERDFSTVFCFNLAVSIALYGVLFVVAPLIADFYNEPQLDGIVKVLNISLIINALSITQQARLTIDLNFRKLAIVTLVSVVISGATAIYIALKGGGVWALVVQVLTASTVKTLLLWLVSRQKMLLVFDKVSFKSLFSFGSKLLLSSLLHTLYTNTYSLVIGKKFASAELGFFNRASVIAQFPSTNFTNVIVRAIYPIQCRMQDDLERLSASFIKYLRMSCFVMFPVMAYMVVAAEPLVRVVLTDEWIDIVPMLRVLCIAYMWDPVMKINHNILNVRGRTDYFLKAEIWKKTMAFTILFVSIPFGVEVMCWGLVLYAFFDMLIISIYTKKIIPVSISTQIKNIVPIFLLTLLTAAIADVPMLFNINDYLKILLSLFLSVGFYFGVAKIMKLSEYNDLFNMIKSLK